MNDKKNKIKFSDKKDGKKIIYEVEKVKEEKSCISNDGENKKMFRNVSGNDWFLAIAEWKNSNDKEWRKKYELKPWCWALIAVFIALIMGGIIAFVWKRNKKKSLDEEKFL